MKTCFISSQAALTIPVFKMLGFPWEEVVCLGAFLNYVNSLSLSPHPPRLTTLSYSTVTFETPRNVINGPAIRFLLLLVAVVHTQKVGTLLQIVFSNTGKLAVRIRGLMSWQNKLGKCAARACVHMFWGLLIPSPPLPAVPSLRADRRTGANGTFQPRLKCTLKGVETGCPSFLFSPVHLLSSSLFTHNVGAWMLTSYLRFCTRNG